MFSKDDLLFKKKLDSLINKHLPEDWQEYPDETLDNHWELSKKIKKSLSEKKWIAPSWPIEYGGLDKSFTQSIILSETMSYRMAPGNDRFGVRMIGPTLLKYGTDFQKEKYLKRLAAGLNIGAFSLSEPQSGSDASNMITTAIKDGNNYILNGTKNWVTNGINSDLVLVFAVTKKGIGHKGISCFIVEKGLSGFECGKAENKLGIRASDTCELYFDNVKISKENRIGQEGEGFKIALSTLDGGRIGIASQALGIATASLNHSIKYSKEREQFGKPIANNQSIQFKIADMAMELEAARLLTWKAAWLKDHHKNFSALASMAKVYASEVAMRASTQCVQIHGGYGYIRETGVERLMRDAKITQIYEGTSEIQRVVIARSLL